MYDDTEGDIRIMNEKNKGREQVYFSKSYFLAALSKCAIRQSPYDYPEGLEKALAGASQKIDTAFQEFQVSHGFVSMDSKSLRRFVDQIIRRVPEILSWNVSKVMQDTGQTYKSQGPGTLLVSRYDAPAAEHDFVDINALIRNVTVEIENIFDE